MESISVTQISRKRSQTLAARPFIKWAGGKGQLLPTIRQSYPRTLGHGINRYAEPFVGGGAVLFDLLNQYHLDEVYISDVNRELIRTYITIRDNPRALVDLLSDLQDDYLSADEDKRKQIYYANRDRFNLLRNTFAEVDAVVLSALFIFLNRTCFNGLYRVNRKGDFNVPIGAYKNPTICDAENLMNVSSALQGVSIVCDKYTAADAFIDETTFVYFDPPYRPLNATSSFTSYAQDGFNDIDQAELATFAKRLDQRGASVLLSNSDPKNTDPEDDFFDSLYRGFRIERISANRMINSKAQDRGVVSELLISNYDTTRK